MFLKLLVSVVVTQSNFTTVAVSEIFRTGLCPDTTSPAPYLLVVDDERVIADTLAVIFRNHGYAVAVSYDAESAIEIAELAPPELVITDFVLPGMNGVDLAVRLQDLIPDCRISLISGQPEEAYRLAAAIPGREFRCFPKPVDPQELLNETAKLLAPGNNSGGPQIARRRRAHLEGGQVQAVFDSGAWEQCVILSGWKDIARHLGRGVRTVQRWETCFGLPVIRPAGRGRSAVCARTEELDAWLRQPHRPDELQRRIRELESENEALRGQLAATVTHEPLRKTA